LDFGLASGSAAAQHNPLAWRALIGPRLNSVDEGPDALLGRNKWQIAKAAQAYGMRAYS
jgi:hypothetical protein